VDKIEGEVKPEILLLVTDKEVKVGTPTIDGAKISIKKLEDEKGDKIIVKKYKAKSRYRRKIGFRPQFTHLQIEKIS
jgi:large subunit ribosomal protein L21